MPVAWEVRQSVIVVSTNGHYRGSELLNSIEEATRRTPGLPLLFDSRSALGYLTPQEIGRRTQWIGAHRQGLISRLRRARAGRSVSRSGCGPFGSGSAKARR